MKKVLLGVLLCSFAACGSSSSSSDEVTADTTTSATVPGDVVISSPTASTAADSALSLKSIFKAVGDASSDDYVAKREAIQELITGAGDCSFTLSIPSADSPECYGPRVNYEGHPDGAPASGQLPVGDTGIWNSTEGEEACAAAKMNELVAKVSSKADNMVKLFAAMACAGRKAELELPAVGAELDLTDAMNTYVVPEVSLLTVSSAVISRLADDADGNAVYQSVITSTFDLPGGERTSTVTLTHVPTSVDNSTYKGKLLMSLVRADADGAGCDVGTGSQDAAVIAYSKGSATDVRYEVNFGEFCGTADPFDADDELVTTSEGDDPNGWLSNWHYGLFGLNPTAGTGAVSFAWQAGSADSHTRVFNVSTEVDAEDADALTGTAYFGYGPAIGDETDEAPRGSILGMICNWAGPGNTHTPLEIIQRQTISKAAGEDTWASASTNILYAPSNSCDAAIGDNFVYEAVGGGDAAAVDGTNPEALDHENDRITDDAVVTNNLIDLADLDFTRATAPDAI